MSPDARSAYGALFTKLWRVNKVLQFSRRRIMIRQVAWPMALLFVGALTVMTVWTIVDPLEWERSVTDTLSGESFGRCTSDHMGAFLTPLIIFMLIPSVLTGVMAWKTKDVDESFSESSWIFVLIILQLEIIIVSVPIIAVLRDISTDGKYIGFVMMLWVFPMSTLVLIMLPKIIAYRAATLGKDKHLARKRGSTVSGTGSGDVRVSGLTPSGGQSSSLNVSSGHSQHAIRDSGMSMMSMNSHVGARESSVSMASSVEAPESAGRSDSQVDAFNSRASAGSTELSTIQDGESAHFGMPEATPEKKDAGGESTIEEVDAETD